MVTNHAAYPSHSMGPPPVSLISYDPLLVPHQGETQTEHVNYKSLWGGEKCILAIPEYILGI